MKWNRQPRTPCARPDCDRPNEWWEYCMRHAKLAQRNGVPYTRDEIVGMRDSNRHQREMDEALEQDPPVIQWVLHPQRRVMVAAHIYDPHAEKKSRRVA